ncbi:hypothetical protein [Sphingobacterium sp. IITKGP-BTPF85]|uniref:hypothetical protein n=1 Tax=Sphingobacterium sp. IITKGP-BTPF85 TaxID=1338009 RepID=UPI00038A36A9|nr:hypothetical protein [Sphingobacterium sp. IITKGP-BTPF85]KKX46793.1 hypothetical protein L950_0229985 [Sphingobacterium sp. IITKGP-BTPF85]
MERKEFIKTASLAALGLCCFPMIDAFGRVPKIINSSEAQVHLRRVSVNLHQKMDKLIDWMTASGWTSHLESILGMKLPANRQEWLLPLGKSTCDRLQESNGFEDFGGNSLLNPGFPQFSLLYHLLASPRVLPKSVREYPDIKHLDLLENYIFAMADLQQNFENSQKLALAVLAYEYRPAYKMPVALGFPKQVPVHADFVFARAGIGRIGDHPYHYDGSMRSFSNQPSTDANKKNIAVTPARYGLFLVEIVPLKDPYQPPISLLSYEKGDKHRDFIRPIRKIIKNEDLDFVFGEYHRNEKLQRLANFRINGKDEDQVAIPANFSLNKSPFIHESATNEDGYKILRDGSDMVSLESIGSSVLLSSLPAPFVRPAMQDGNRVTFIVPACWDTKYYSNRRYGSFKLIPPDSKDALDLIVTDGFFRATRRTARFGTARNAPLFANIKHVQESGSEVHLDENFEGFEAKIVEGKYAAGLFEDSICDGCISVSYSDGALGSFCMANFSL